MVSVNIFWPLSFFLDSDLHLSRKSCFSFHFMSCHVMSCHVMSCHVMSCHIMSCHVICHFISFDRSHITFKAVASLLLFLPGGQDSIISLIFPRFPLVPLIFPFKIFQFLFNLFLILVFRVGAAGPPGKALATPLIPFDN